MKSALFDTSNTPFSITIYNTHNIHDLYFDFVPLDCCGGQGKLFSCRFRRTGELMCAKCFNITPESLKLSNVIHSSIIFIF